MIVNVPVIQTSIPGDTNPSPNSLVLRDAAGGITVGVVDGTTFYASNWQGTVATLTTSATAGAATDILCDCTSGAITLTLPLASANTGIIYNVIKKDSSGNAVTLSSVLGTSTISSQYAGARIVSDGTNWYSR